MAVFKLGEIITELTGSIGGQTFQVCNTSTSVRNKPLGIPSNTDARSFHRNLVGTLSRLWGTLPAVVKQSYVDYIHTYRGYEWLGPLYITPKMLFMRWQLQRTYGNMNLFLSPVYIEMSMFQYQSFKVYGSPVPDTIQLIWDSFVPSTTETWFNIFMTQRQRSGITRARGYRALTVYNLFEGQLEPPVDFFHGESQQPIVGSVLGVGLTYFGWRAPWCAPRINYSVIVE